MLPADTPENPPASFLEVFAAETARGAVSFARFMELALYHPQLGYYRKNRQRVGFSRSADFYTATSANPVFGELVAAAAQKLLGAERAKKCRFVEIGAEPSSGLSAQASAFAAYQAVRLGDDIDAALHGDCVVFSNELFDAQPFHRLRWRAGAWREIGVELSGETLRETELQNLSPEITAIRERLPDAAPESYTIDVPLAAEQLCKKIAAANWCGLFLAFDYGKSWEELTTVCPEGTLRAYRSHQQSNALLDSPSEQDLTGHVCWDWLSDVLRAENFPAPQLSSQESFFLHHAREQIGAIVAAAKPGPDPRRAQLQSLLHPALMGQSFQALHAIR